MRSRPVPSPVLRGPIASWCQGFLLVLAGLMIFAAPAAAREVQKLTSARGITIWLVEDHGLPLISVGFAIRGGAALDPSGQEGLSDLTANMLTEGAGDLQSNAFKSELDRLGSKLSMSAVRRGLTGGLVTLTKHQDRSFELLRLALTKPRLEDDPFQQLKRRTLSELAVASRRNEQRAVTLFNGLAFKGHPYGQEVGGTVESVRALKLEDVSVQVGRLLSRDRLHVVIVGDMTADAAKRDVDRIFGEIPIGKPIDGVPPTSLREFRARETAPSGQVASTIVFGLPMPAVRSKQFFAALVLNHIIGSGNFDARLTREIRVRRGLTYAVRTSIIADETASYAVGVLSTKPQNADEALAATERVLEEFRNTGPSERELKGAVSQLIGNYLLQLTTSPKIASHYLNLWLDGLAADYGERRREALLDVTVEDVAAVADQYLGSEKLRTITVEP